MSPTFAGLGVPADLIAALDRRGITIPFPIQAAALPDALAGQGSVCCREVDRSVLGVGVTDLLGTATVGVTGAGRDMLGLMCLLGRVGRRGRAGDVGDGRDVVPVDAVPKAEEEGRREQPDAVHGGGDTELYEREHRADLR